MNLNDLSHGLPEIRWHIRAFMVDKKVFADISSATNSVTVRIITRCRGKPFMVGKNISVSFRRKKVEDKATQGPFSTTK